MGLNFGQARRGIELRSGTWWDRILHRHVVGPNLAQARGVTDFRSAGNQGEGGRQPSFVAYRLVTLRSPKHFIFKKMCCPFLVQRERRNHATEKKTH